ncbi:MAG: M16 family metallopeptidase [Aestuariibaculum sp.]
MRNIFIFIVTFTTIVAPKGFAQEINLNTPLPTDATYKKGVLPNGLTYYIKSTDVVKDAASYYIMQNVGSILENDDQKGLAHFLEHMAFNGTEHFPGKGILNTLQKHGAVFGKDINAYTAFDETVYNLSNIPTKDGLIDTCLTVLLDWSNYLLLTDEEIDAERGVIKEEWRTRQNGYMRLYEVSMPIMFNHSKYADRMPIGTMDVVENFKYKALRDFYHDWYRTDLQAIAVIGDVDVNDVEQKIIGMFSKIPAIKNPKERYIVDIPENKDMQYSLGKDPEISTASMTFGIRHKSSLNNETVADLKRDLLQSMAIQMLSLRISEKSRTPEANFLGARVGNGGLSRTSKAFTLSISPKQGKQKEAFTEVLTEVVRAVKFGYVQPEIDRTIASMKNSYENQIAKIDSRRHGNIQRLIQNNYFSNKTIVDIAQEYEIAKQIFGLVTAKELHNTIKDLYTKNNRFLNVIGVEGQDNLTETQAKQIINTVENDNGIQPYTEALEGKTLVSGLNIKTGKIIEEQPNAVTGATTFVLSNGVKVHYKFTNKDKDQVRLSATSYGGKSLLKDDDLPSANFMGSLVGKSGLGDFSLTELQKVMAGKTAQASVGLGQITETVNGSSNTKDVETMLQLVHLRFVKPRFDEQAFKVLQNNLNNYLVRRSKDLNEKIGDSMTIALYGKNNPKARLFDQNYVNAISFDKIKAIYSDRFENISDFEFFIVGDTKAEDLKPLLEKYMASIPTKVETESYLDNGAKWISNTIDRDIFLEMENPKASISVAYEKEMPYTPANAIYTRALGDMLQLRVTETVREAEGGSYSPRAKAQFSRQPKAKAYVSFNFDCNPDMADNLSEIVKGELQKIANGTINEEDLNKTKTNFIKEREQAKNRNGYDMSMLTRYFRFGEDINDPKNFTDIVNNMSKASIQNIAKQILDGSKSYEIIIKPKQ